MPQGVELARRTAERIGRIGVWSFEPDTLPAAEARAFARRVEELGYGALWILEGAQSKDVLAHSALLLSWTERIAVAPGIANIWARDAVAMANGAKMLGEAFPGRFVLGLGVSHAPAVARRGSVYDRPLERMREYLDAMDKARYAGREPSDEVPRVLAALGPRMLGLAASRASGAHPYFVPAEHTAFARATLGPGPLLAVEQAVVLETDASTARTVARGHMAGYLRLDNYTNNLKRFGFGDEDIANGGSDRLVDAIVAWGTLDNVVGRVRRHLDDGADHVCLQVLASPSRTSLDQLRELAAALL